ncbi:protein SDA1 homolog, partial [Trichonephila clavata]
MFKGEKCVGGNLSKNRLTALECPNISDTDKMKLLAIVKSKYSIYFKQGGLGTSQNWKITEKEVEKIDDFENLGISREKFRNNVSVYAIVITFEIPAPKDIITKTEAEANGKNNESDDDNNECEGFQTTLPPTYSMALACAEKLRNFLEAGSANDHVFQPTSLRQFKNLVKRDPPSYYEEFQTHYQHFLALLQLFELNPQEYNDNFADLVHFLAQVSTCYKEELKDFPEMLKKILKENGTVLDPLMRLCLVKALILMRNKDVLLPTDLITLFFELLRCKDKVLRKLLQTHILSDLKRINSKHKNVKVNNALQNFMYSMLSDNHITAARMSLEIMIDLYRRNIWRDAKTVNTIATACLSKDQKILVKALQFFLNIDEEINESDSDSEDEATVLKAVVTSNLRNKKSRKRKRLLEKTKKVLKKSKKHKLDQESCNFAAIHLLNDPSGLAEKLYGMLQKFNSGFQIKLLLMNLISRLIGIHELMLLNFYPYLQKYLRPHQIDVTKILLCAAQATHEQVPPDIAATLIKEILDNFVTERNSPEGIAVG